MAKGEHIEAAVEALLAAPPGERMAGGQSAIESVLTEGYAKALELEAERLGAADGRTIATLGERVRSLRSRLEALARRHGARGSPRDDNLDCGPGSRG
jgi:hypothetical protein